ncbi:MAG: hypothetical protein Q8906_05380 [Bacillota bacterium]|nr:hypothetical protein [Bacillota bacterium]
MATIFYVCGLIVLFDAWVVDYQEMNLLYVIPIIFTLFYSVGRYLQQMEHHHQLHFVKSIASSIIIAGLLTGAITLLLPFAKWTFFGILQAAIMLTGFLATPILNLVEGKKLELKIHHQPADDEDPGVRNNIAHHFLKYTHLEVIPGWVWLLLLIIVFIGIFLILGRKKVEVLGVHDPSSSVSIEHVPSVLDKKRKLPFFRQRQPQDYVRKLLFDLLLFAEKNKMGRSTNETVREWFDRLGLPKNEDLLLAYDQVRYGNAVISKRESLQYISFIDGLKQEIKIRSEKLKEKNSDSKEK